MLGAIAVTSGHERSPFPNLKTTMMMPFPGIRLLSWPKAAGDAKTPCRIALRNLYRAARYLLLLVLAVGLLPSEINTEAKPATPSECTGYLRNVGTVPSGNLIRPTASEAPALFVAVLTQRSRLPSVRLGSVTMRRTSDRSTTGEAAPRRIYQQNGLTVGLDRRFSDSVPPVKGTFVFRC